MMPPPPGPWRPNPFIAETFCRHPRPGPMDWGWRCINCGWAMREHRPWWQRGRSDWVIRKAVWGYRLRVLFNWPYKNVMTAEELRRRYSCACGTTIGTEPLDGQRMPCCPPDPLTSRQAMGDPNA